MGILNIMPDHMNAKENMNASSGEVPKSEKGILLFGDRGVGKTTLVRALTGELFDPNEAVRSVKSRNMSEFNDVPLVDFSGQAIFHDMIREKLSE